MIGSSDGKMYESPFDLAIGRPLEAPEKATGASKQNAPTQGSQPLVDRTKDVPLAASALHKNGEMYGIAIDKDAPIRPEYDQYIYKHEADEFAYMKDLITNGMQPGEAYHKAHDHITPMESARVQADLGEKGLEDYKQYWRDVASNSTKKENPDRHPDAHTTTYGLDEKELGLKFAGDVVQFPMTPEKKQYNTDFGKKLEELDPNLPKAPVVPLRRDALFRGLKGAGITATDAQFEPLNPMSPHYQNPGGHAREGIGTWFRGGEGKWRQEIPDLNSKIKPEGLKQAQEGSALKLNQIFHHPELFKSYPEFKDVDIIKLPKEYEDTTRGATAKSGKLIALNKDLSEEGARSTLLHEIQHLIQKKEGFTWGSSNKEMQPVVEEALRRKGLVGKARPSEDEIEDAVYEAYHNIGGEVESRNVQFRRDWPLEALDIFPPNLTEDVPRNRQLNSPE